MSGIVIGDRPCRDTETPHHGGRHSGKHPTLSELHRSIRLEIFLEDGSTTGPLPRLPTTGEILRPVTGEETVVVAAVGHRRHMTSNFTRCVSHGSFLAGFQELERALQSGRCELSEVPWFGFVSGPVDTAGVVENVLFSQLLISHVHLILLVPWVEDQVQLTVGWEHLPTSGHHDGEVVSGHESVHRYPDFDFNFSGRLAFNLEPVIITGFFRFIFGFGHGDMGSVLLAGFGSTCKVNGELGCVRVEPACGEGNLEESSSPYDPVVVGVIIRVVVLT